MVELLGQTNCYVNNIELVSLQPVLLFYQLRYGLAPVRIYGDLVGSRLPTFISDILKKKKELHDATLVDKDSDVSDPYQRSNCYGGTSCITL